MSVLLIAGYRRHGKDTLGQKIMKKDLSAYQLFQEKSTSNCLRQFVQTSCLLRSIADQIKYEVAQIHQTTVEEIEEKKDCPKKKYRQDLIRLATMRKYGDETYWIRQVDLAPVSTGTPILITDWRFWKEKTYLEDQAIPVVTARIFRREGGLPS